MFLIRTSRLLQCRLRFPPRNPGLVLALRDVSYDSAADQQGLTVPPTEVEAFHLSQVPSSRRVGLFSLEIGRLDPWFVLSVGSVWHIVIHGLFSESRTYNIDVYDAAGSELCSMVGLQLKEVSGASPAGIKIRYDIVSQPIIVSWPVPRLPTDDFTVREIQDEVYKYLDRVAQEVIRGSLVKEPVIGEEVLRDHI